MTQKNKEESQEVSREQQLDTYTKDLAQQIMKLMSDFAAMVSENMGSKFTAGLLPYLKKHDNGTFAPDVRLVILPAKTIKDGDTAEDTGTGTEAKE